RRQHGRVLPRARRRAGRGGVAARRAAAAAAPTTASTAAAPAPPAARARALPRRIDAFVGREREVGEVRRLLAASPLVTLVGPGGVGKTRLALEVSDGPSERDGAWLVELAPLAEGTLVAPAAT